jgi:hypothetical protein
MRFAVVSCGFAALAFAPLVLARGEVKSPVVRLSIDPPAIASDRSVKYDYDIVYVRAPRRTDGNGRLRN